MRPLLCCLLLVGWAAHLFGAAPPRGTQEMKKLIEALGEEDEDLRKGAEKKLRALDELAVPAVRQASKAHLDPDVRLRAVVIAAAIEEALYGVER